MTVFLAAAVSVLCAPCLQAIEEGSADRIETKTSKVKYEEYKNLPKKVMSVKGEDLSGRIYFSDYYSMGGEKCGAFLEAEDGSLVCILDTMKSNQLRTDMGNASGEVELKGNIRSDEHGSYLEIEDYSIEE
jgi:hypothetical protein